MYVCMYVEVSTRRSTLTKRSSIRISNQNTRTHASKCIRDRALARMKLINPLDFLLGFSIALNNLISKYCFSFQCQESHTNFSLSASDLYLLPLQSIHFVVDHCTTSWQTAAVVLQIISSFSTSTTFILLRKLLSSATSTCHKCCPVQCRDLLCVCSCLRIPGTSFCANLKLLSYLCCSRSCGDNLHVSCLASHVQGHFRRRIAGQRGASGRARGMSKR